MIKSLNKKTTIVTVSILVIVALSFFLPVFAQQETLQTEQSKDSLVVEILKLLGIGGISGAAFGGLVNSFLARRRDRQRSRSLIIAFLAELIYNFRRCVLYYEQLHVAGKVSKSSLYELTDAGALSSFANVIDNPEVISSILELKSHYYQIRRHTDPIASEIVEKELLMSRIDELEQAASAADGQSKKAMAEEALRLSSEVRSLEKAINYAQGSALAFFDYESIINHIKIILGEGNKLMPESQVVARIEREFRNNCRAKDYVDKKKNEQFKLGPEELAQWRKNVEKEFIRIRNEYL